jgi:hypothetical protein
MISKFVNPPPVTDLKRVDFDFGAWLDAAARYRAAMRTKTKDRIVNLVLILLFLGIMGGSAYYILKTMTHWRVKGLG